MYTRVFVVLRLIQALCFLCSFENIAGLIATLLLRVAVNIEVPFRTVAYHACVLTGVTQSIPH